MDNKDARYEMPTSWPGPEPDKRSPDLNPENADQEQEGSHELRADMHEGAR